MVRDGEIPAIFNPKRVRAPSVVVTGDSPNGGFSNILNSSNPQIIHQDSISSSQQDPSEAQVTSQQATQFDNREPCRGGGIVGGFGHHSGGIDSETPTTDLPDPESVQFRRLKACKESCCSELAQKMYFGVCVTILVTASWVAATHCIKFLYLNRNTYTPLSAEDIDTSSSTAVDLNLDLVDEDEEENSASVESELSASGTEEEESPIKIFEIPKAHIHSTIFNAPFFAAWFFTNFAFLFFPIYVLGRVTLRKCDKPGEILGDVLRGFRDRGFTIGRFLNRCLSFCILWLVTTYLYTLSLRVLFATDAMALFATNVACVYLLSWVILHEQFVGVRIVAVILCDTGIALLAYMDGITESRTLSGVVLATLAAAGYAVFRVMFRKVMGDPPVGQIAFVFTTLGFLNATMLWPISFALYLSGTESMPSERVSWIILLIASILLLVFHILIQFSAAVTYNMFVTLGLITAVPVSGALDVILYGATFAGMKLAGVILIAIGFFLVMFPENWPDYITRLLRKSCRAILRYQCCCELAEIHYAHSKYHLIGSQREKRCSYRRLNLDENGQRSILYEKKKKIYHDRNGDQTMGTRSSQRFINRATSNNYRLSDGIHKVPSAFPFWPCEMTDSSPTMFSNNSNPQHSNFTLHHSNNSALPGIIPNRSPPPGGDAGGGRLFSYFGADQERERKKSETCFFNLGFRRKSTVVYYAATD